ncbi:hypothetical protein CL635_01560 [bacterium]|nr:hypothetical protein [bacterium]|tara:strand:+ start:2248 stop:2580 length:333 start_codon:yes stop_codon:yes gene_type:complete
MTFEPITDPNGTRAHLNELVITAGRVLQDPDFQERERHAVQTIASMPGADVSRIVAKLQEEYLTANPTEEPLTPIALVNVAYYKRLIGQDIISTEPSFGATLVGLEYIGD